MRPDKDTKIFGIVGFPLGHTLSPVIHNAAFRKSGINAVYLAFETRDLRGAIEALRPLGIKGISVTIPYKVKVLFHLDQVDPDVKLIGAVNTIVNDNGYLVGYNTDGAGLLAALEYAGVVSFRKALIIGAGGFARAAAFSLVSRGVEVLITNRDRTRGETLASEMACRFSPLESLRRIEADLVVNATPVGMEPLSHSCPIAEDLLLPGTVVVDAVYHPTKTRLLSVASERGCKAVGGMDILLFQAARQFKLWTGLNPPIEIMRRAVDMDMSMPKPGYTW